MSDGLSLGMGGSLNELPQLGQPVNPQQHISETAAALPTADSIAQWLEDVRGTLATARHRIHELAEATGMGAIGPSSMGSPPHPMGMPEQPLGHHEMLDPSPFAAPQSPSAWSRPDVLNDRELGRERDF